MGITVTDDASVNSDYDAVREVKGTTMAVINNNSDSKRVTAEYTKKNVFPGNVTGTSSLFSTNPVEDSYFDIWVEGVLETLNPGAMAFIVNIEYDVLCYELKDLGPS